MSIILGIDPGSRVTGYGVIRVIGQQVQYLASGCIRLKSGEMSTRLTIIYDSIGELLAQYHPDGAAIEQVFVGNNASAALKLGHARAAAMLALGHADIPFSEYAARTVKQAVAGSGSADKIQVQKMVVRLLLLNKAPAADAADALAIALCHAHRDNNYSRAL